MNKDKFTWHEGEVTIEVLQCTTCKYKIPTGCAKCGKIPSIVWNRKAKCGMYEEMDSDLKK